MYVSMCTRGATPPSCLPHMMCLTRPSPTYNGSVIHVHNVNATGNEVTCQQRAYTFTCICNVNVMCYPIQVNDVSMVNATHTEAVSVLKNMKEVCSLVVSREVLVVMPDEHTEEDGE